MTSTAVNSKAATVGIVGAGFSGLLTAIHLLQRDPDLTVRLIEKGERFGTGRAYAAANPAHLLNVRASNMSAFPDRPSHFTDWLNSTGSGASASDGFVSRGAYGEYLQSLLRLAMVEGAAGRLLLEHDEVVSAATSAYGYDLQLAMGRSVAVDALILAVGLGPPKAAPGASDEALASPFYVGDPWSVAPGDLPPGDILLVGTGLTMVDVALSLGRPDQRLFAISRHGLLPHSHAATAPGELPMGELTTPREAVAAVRGLAKRIGWRSAVDGVRPITPAIWRSWDIDARAQFIRLVRPWWDIHRHRMAPAVADHLRRLLQEGRLQVNAAEVRRIEPAVDGLRVTLRLRGQNQERRRRFAAVVNCTGLSGDLGGSPLLRSLIEAGLVAPDPLRLGAAVDGDLRVLSASGDIVPGLYAVGPLTRWARWETIAIPDLKFQTQDVAQLVTQYVRRRSAANAPRTAQRS